MYAGCAGAVENEQAVEQEQGAHRREDFAKGGWLAASQPISDRHSMTLVSKPHWEKMTSEWCLERLGLVVPHM